MSSGLARPVSHDKPPLLSCKKGRAGRLPRTTRYRCTRTCCARVKAHSWEPERSRGQIEEAHLPRIGFRKRRGRLQVVVVGIESADQGIQPERGFPDVGKQFTAPASALDRAAAFDSGIEAFVPAAPALESSCADLQSASSCGVSENRSLTVSRDREGGVQQPGDKTLVYRFSGGI